MAIIVKLKLTFNKKQASGQASEAAWQFNYLQQNRTSFWW